jgi:hypothetical protein
LRRNFRVRLAKIFFVGNVRRSLRNFRALRRQTGGDIFRAFNFIRVSFVKDALVAALFRDDVGARLRGVPVGLLRILAESALGAEAHSTAAA